MFVYLCERADGIGGDVRGRGDSWGWNLCGKDRATNKQPREMENWELGILLGGISHGDPTSRGCSIDKHYKELLLRRTRVMDSLSLVSRNSLPIPIAG